MGALALDFLYAALVGALALLFCCCLVLDWVPADLKKVSSRDWFFLPWQARSLVMPLLTLTSANPFLLIKKSFSSSS